MATTTSCEDFAEWIEKAVGGPMMNPEVITKVPKTPTGLVIGGAVVVGGLLLFAAKKLFSSPKP